ncbi:exocyst complex component EXO70H1 [Brachypodium distachyon]|uniref:Exocyst subunit Exo70 family protein n=1 Tax=Brachypodium distachyon TaxID=15368 RepID=A0A0Q3KQC9_BRADI|nr:exocyst complex component EXO70H1 [Brachypodium distachyon]KQJ82157.1 hypothetical protein BRADI_5g06870v3 [Brachypodium distachyon]|eukprot:XP_003581122.1 exocyst complex component EXO70H1 [Brachypodium distachyon]
MPRAGTRTSSLAMLARPRPRRTLPATVVDDTVASAAALLDKWHPDDDSIYSLFLDSTAEEADEFLRAAASLHRSMLFYASGAETTGTKSLHGGGQGLIQAQALLDTAMRRLQLELHLLLDSLPAVLSFHRRDVEDHDYDDDDDDDYNHDDHEDGNISGSGIGLRETCAHLRAVAEAMMAAGYGKEFVSTFKSRRRASVSGTLQRLLGFSPSLQQAQIPKLAWDQVDAKIIQPWLSGARAAFASVFTAERDLCDGVFSGDNGAAFGDAVFAAIADDQATSVLVVAEAAVARARRAPERLFRVLDVHDALAETILPAVVSAFGEKSEVTSRAVSLVMIKVGDAARGIVASFEAAIQKEPSKATVAAGGAVHPLTRYVINYLAFLADYETALTRIFSSNQQEQFPFGSDTSSFSVGGGGGSTSSSSSSSLDLPSSSTLSLASNPIGWLVFILLRKLDAKAGSYKEAALSYLFLANNTHYVAKKAGPGTRLEGVLGEEWAEAQRAKARGYVDVYVRAAWGSKVIRGGEEAVMEAVAMQDRWVAADEEMGNALRAAVRAAVVPAYRLVYRRQGAAARLTPGDVNAMIGGLFGGHAHAHAVASDESVAADRRRTSQQQEVLIRKQKLKNKQQAAGAGHY